LFSLIFYIYIFFLNCIILSKFLKINKLISKFLKINKLMSKFLKIYEKNSNLKKIKKCTFLILPCFNLTI